LNVARRTAVAVGAAAALVAGLAAPAVAASPGVQPATVNQAANAGATIVVNKTVHTPAIPPKPDVVLLVDTTGSMGGAIDNVKTNLHAVITNVKSSQPTAQFAVASYRDEGDGAELFTVRQNLTADEPAVQAGVDSLAAGGGGDLPEAWVNGLFQVSTGAIAYRTGSSRIVVVVGDAPSHDPSAGHSLAQAITALGAASTRVVAVNVSGLDSTGQATAVVDATGGSLVPVSTDGVSAAILAGLHDLDVTVTPQATCDTGLTATFDHADVTVPSGTDAGFVETLSLAAGATQGSTLHCTVDFLLNGAPAGDAFIQHVTITVNDRTPPVVTVDDKTVEATSPAGAVVTYPATAVDNVDGPLTPTCVPPSGGTFALGATTVTCTAKDAAGNVGSDTATIRVVDTTPPRSSCVPGPNPGGHIPASNNPDGYYTIGSTDLVDTAVDIFIHDTASTAVFGPYPNTTNIKLVQAPGATPDVKPGSGAVAYKVTLKGDAIIIGVDNAHNASAGVSCLVPPGPKN
jgi:Mg-chelatase subunit ChlD